MEKESKFEEFRKRVYYFVTVGYNISLAGKLYDAFMIVVIVIGLVPLMCKETTPTMALIDKGVGVVFIIDYLIRWLVADYILKKHSWKSFVRYPFTFMAILDILSILPSFMFLNNGFRLFRIFRLMMVCRVFKIARLMHYSKNVLIMRSVFRKQKTALLYVMAMVIVYILVCAMIMFNVEPDLFHNFFEAVYWSAISLTTIGYGDICPVTVIGRLFTVLSAIMGIAIVALPSSIITAGYMRELERYRNNKSDDK